MDVAKTLFLFLRSVSSALGIKTTVVTDMINQISHRFGVIWNHVMANPEVSEPEDNDLDNYSHPHPIQKHLTTPDRYSFTMGTGATEYHEYREWHTEPGTIVTAVWRKCETEVTRTKRKSLTDVISELFGRANTTVTAWGARTPALGSTSDWVSVYVTVPTTLPIEIGLVGVGYSSGHWSALSPGDTISDMDAIYASNYTPFSTRSIAVDGVTGMNVAERDSARVKVHGSVNSPASESFIAAFAVIAEAVFSDVAHLPGAFAEFVVELASSTINSLASKGSHSTSAPKNHTLKSGYTLHSSNSTRTHVFHSVRNDGVWSDTFARDVYQALNSSSDKSDAYVHRSEISTNHQNDVITGDYITQKSRWKVTSIAGPMLAGDCLPAADAPKKWSGSLDVTTPHGIIHSVPPVTNPDSTSAASSTTRVTKSTTTTWIFVNNYPIAAYNSGWQIRAPDTVLPIT